MQEEEPVTAGGGGANIHLPCASGLAHEHCIGGGKRRAHASIATAPVHDDEL